ncbi:MAG: ArsR/SmtB family transcription factor [Opitutales bacterium]
MATPKSTLFPADQVALAAFAAALSHPARIAIVTLLQERGEVCCGEIVKHLPLAQPTVSQHLKAMDKAGLLQTRQCGPKVCYSLDCEKIREFCHSFQCTLGTGQETPVLQPPASGAELD